MERNQASDISMCPEFVVEERRGRQSMLNMEIRRVVSGRKTSLGRVKTEGRKKDVKSTQGGIRRF